MRKKTFLSHFLPMRDQWYRYAIWVFRDEWEAEETVQEFYLKLWKMRHKLSTVENLEAYTFRMLENQCRDRFRKSSFNLKDVDDYQETLSYVDNDTFEIEEMSNLLSLIVSQLPENQRLILQLRNVEELSIERIAQLLGIKKNTVEVNLSRARKKVREELKKANKDGKG